MHAGTNTAGMQYECQASKQAVTSAKGLLASSTTTALRAQTIEGNCFTVGRPAKCKLGVNLLQKRSIKNLLDFVSRAAYRPRERNLSVTPRICPIMPNYAQCYRLAFSLVSQSCRFFRGLASLVLSIFFDEKSRWVTACLSFLCLLKPVAIHADDLTDEAEGWVADMLNDIEYGLGSYYVDYRVTIETSPDSINWVNSKGELSQFYDEDRKIRINNASWVNSSIGGDYIPQSGEAFRRGSFHVTIAELNSERYVLQPVIDEGLVPFNPTFNNCLFIDPFAWTAVVPRSFATDKYDDCQRQAFVDSFHENCVRATRDASGVVFTRWIGKIARKDGTHIAFKEGKFKDSLPIERQSYTANRYFKAEDVPATSQCRQTRSFKLEWVKFKQINVPSKISGIVFADAPPSNFTELKFDVDLKFFEPESKQYRDAEKQWMETLGKYPVMKKFLEIESEPK